jgi:hypothetical protein
VGEGGRGVSAATATLIAGGLAIIGTLLGVLVGLFGERYVRQFGALRCDIDAWTGAQHASPGVPEDRIFEVNFFNEKDVDLALWDVRLEFAQGNEEPERVSLRFADTGEWVSVLNLPSRVAVSRSMRVTAGGPVLERARRANQVRFVGIVPGGKEFGKDLPRW